MAPAEGRGEKVIWSIGILVLVLVLWRLLPASITLALDRVFTVGWDLSLDTEEIVLRPYILPFVFIGLFLLTRKFCKKNPETAWIWIFVLIVSLVHQVLMATLFYDPLEGSSPGGPKQLRVSGARAMGNWTAFNMSQEDLMLQRMQALDSRLEQLAHNLAD
mmetsp:Transcript_58673/g.136953  ORF Transcript_58673/g.136953 Transcript_58673/m.136953 type:complete len:161 (-) Transcript_58673:56-538(-)